MALRHRQFVDNPTLHRKLIKDAVQHQTTTAIATRPLTTQTPCIQPKPVLGVLYPSVFRHLSCRPYASPSPDPTGRLVPTAKSTTVSCQDHARRRPFPGRGRRTPTASNPSNQLRRTHDVIKQSHPGCGASRESETGRLVSAAPKSEGAAPVSHHVIVPAHFSLGFPILSQRPRDSFRLVTSRAQALLQPSQHLSSG